MTSGMKNMSLNTQQYPMPSSKTRATSDVYGCTYLPVFAWPFFTLHWSCRRLQ